MYVISNTIYKARFGLDDWWVYNRIKVFKFLILKKSKCYYCLIYFFISFKKKKYQTFLYVICSTAYCERIFVSLKLLKTKKKRKTNKDIP